MRCVKAFCLGEAYQPVEYEQVCEGNVHQVDP